MKKNQIEVANMKSLISCLYLIIAIVIFLITTLPIPCAKELYYEQSRPVFEPFNVYPGDTLWTFGSFLWTVAVLQIYRFIFVISYYRPIVIKMDFEANSRLKSGLSDKLYVVGIFLLSIFSIGWSSKITATLIILASFLIIINVYLTYLTAINRLFKK